MTPFFLAAILASCSAGGRVDGERAFADLRRVVEFGPRPPGSEALEKTRAYVLAELGRIGVPCERDPFDAPTPIGKIRMENVLATIPGDSPRSILFAGHIDTKLFEGLRFVGANDGGSSTALPLELARVLASKGKPRVTYRFAFFDGEEAIREWTRTDGLYGSRHLAGRWKEDGTLRNLGAMILFDMVGDRDLQIFHETHGSGWLRGLIGQAAIDLGHGDKFFRRAIDLEDDFIPFHIEKIATIDLIDYAYGPPAAGAGRWWHTAEDTLDKVSAESLEVVGNVVLRALPRIEDWILK